MCIAFQEEYQKEGIDWSFKDFVDNRPCLDLIEGRTSVFSLMNEVTNILHGLKLSNNLIYVLSYLSSKHFCRRNCVVQLMQGFLSFGSRSVVWRENWTRSRLALAWRLAYFTTAISLVRGLRVKIMCSPYITLPRVSLTRSKNSSRKTRLGFVSEVDFTHADHFLFPWRPSKSPVRVESWVHIGKRCSPALNLPSYLPPSIPARSLFLLLPTKWGDVWR